MLQTPQDVSTTGTMIAARVPSDLVRAFSAIAQREERTLSAELRHIMRRHVSLNASTPLAGGADKVPAGGPDHGQG